MRGTVVWWVRNDLRLHDNVLVSELTRLKGRAVLPVFFLDQRHSDSRCAPRRRQWILDSLRDLKQSLGSLGSDLHVIQSTAPQWFAQHRHLVDAVWCSREFCSEETEEEEAVRAVVPMLRIFDTRSLFTFDASVVEAIPLSYSKFRFKVAPKLTMPPVADERPSRFPPLPAGLSISPIPEQPNGNLETDKRSAIRGLKAGESGGLQRLSDYFTIHASAYHKTRNQLIGHAFSTKFSIYLQLGCISPRVIWQRIEQVKDGKAQEALKLELLWREYWLWLALKLGRQYFWWAPLRDQKPHGIEPSSETLEKWKTGRTGNDFVDANMRELLATGFMSNRGRQVVASYLIFDLKQDWREGALHFERHLIDHDAAANTGNWKYLAGTGTDVRPTKKDVKKQRSMYDPKNDYSKLWRKI